MVYGPLVATATGKFKGKRGFRKTTRKIHRKKTPMYRHIDGATQYHALRMEQVLSINENQAVPGAVKINMILQTPLWARLSKMYDVGRICGYSIKIMPTQTPVTVYSYVSHDDQSVVSGSDAVSIFLRQPSLRIDNLKDKGFYRSVNLKNDSRFRDFTKLTGGTGLSGILTGIGGQMNTSLKYILKDPQVDINVTVIMSFTLQTKGFADLVNGLNEGTI